MSELSVSSLAAGMTVSPQPTPEDFAVLAARGVTMVVNDRPDGEEPGQLPAARAGEIALANGMEYRHVPVKLTDITAHDVDAFGRAVAEASGPVHAHCRTGIRAATLWALNEFRSGRRSADQVCTAIEAAGFDPKTALAWIAAHQQAGAP